MNETYIFKLTDEFVEKISPIVKAGCFIAVSIGVNTIRVPKRNIGLIVNEIISLGLTSSVAENAIEAMKKFEINLVRKNDERNPQ